MIDGINIEQREIIITPFPFSDLSSNKKRPALVISNNIFNNKNQDVLCCLITSNFSECGELIISNNDMEKGFLEFESRIKPQRLFTLNKKIIKKSIGKINIKTAEKVNEEINKLIKLVI